MAIDWLKLSDELRSEVARHGFEVVAFTHSQSKSPQLRLYADHRERGFTIEDATFLSRVLIVWLQARLPESVEFRLDVSSPGMDRPLVEPWQYKKKLDRFIQITHRENDKTLYTPGVLVAVDDSGVQLKEGESIRQYAWSEILESKEILPMPATPRNAGSKKTKGDRR